MIGGDTQTIHNRHPTRQFTLGFYLDIVLAPFCADRRIESKAHCYWIGQRDPVLSRLNFVRLPGVTIAFHRKTSQLSLESLNQRNIVFPNHGVSARKLPTDKFHGHSTEHDDASRLRVDPHVVFGHRSYISLAAWRASHDHAPSNLCGDARFLCQREGEIGEGRKRDDDKTRVGFDRADDCIDSMKLFSGSTWRWIIVITKSVATVKPRGIRISAQQRLFRSRIDRRIRTAQ